MDSCEAAVHDENNSTESQIGELQFSLNSAFWGEP